MNCPMRLFRIVSQMMGCFFFVAASAMADPPSMAVIRADLETGFENAGWNHDRYADLPSLDAHKSITMADLDLTSGSSPADADPQSTPTNTHSTKVRMMEVLTRGAPARDFSPGWR